MYLIPYEFPTIKAKDWLHVKLMLSYSDCNSHLFLNKLPIDARLTRKKPTQQYDLRQSVRVHLKHFMNT